VPINFAKATAYMGCSHVLKTACLSGIESIRATHRQRADARLN
jgi:hypothetical protein